MKKSEAIAILNQQLSFIPELSLKPPYSHDFKKWKRDTEIAIERIFGSTTRHLKDFDDVRYSAWMSETHAEEVRTFTNGLHDAEAVLKSLIDEVERYHVDNKEPARKSGIHAVERLIDRFHLVVRSLRARFNDRNPFNVEDEYDVQDLLRALLVVEFDDIRQEEWTPSYAGGGSRIDFLLKIEQIAIEAKKTRPSMSTRELTDQLIVDKDRYRSHPDCRCLVAFVYDPEGRLENPRGFERDLSETTDQLEVKVFVRP